MSAFPKNRFISIWLGAAMVVVIARGFAVADLGYDLTIQLQAAQNLVDGHGLSIHKLDGEEDLAQSSQLITLTHFPAGYSLMAAALMALGLGPAAVVKIGGAIATMLGWWGWATLAYAFFQQGLERGAVWRWLAIVLAISSPLLLTPGWQGTDIFLWAAIPWTIHWLVRGAARTTRSFWYDLTAGIACGLGFLFRYAGAFLLVYAGCLILAQTKLVWKTLFVRALGFAVGCVPLVAAQLYINKVLATGPPAAVAAGSSHLFLAYGKAFAASFWMLPAANFLFAWWLPSRLLGMLTQPGATLLGQSGSHAPWWIAFPLAIAVFAVPLLMLWAGRWNDFRDPRPAAIGLFLALPIFLWVCTIAGVANPLMGDYSFVADLRYYAPLIPLSVLAAYGLAASTNSPQAGLRRTIRLAGGAYVSVYAALAAVSLLVLVIPKSVGEGKRQKLMGTSHVYKWPGGGIEYDFSTTRQRAVALLKENPKAILITDHPQWFYADSSCDRSRIHRLGDLKSTYVTGPAEIFVVAWDAGGRDNDLYWRVVDGAPRRSEELTGLDNFHLVQRFPAEQMKILEAEVPASTRIGLKAAVPANGAVAAQPN